jgi:hypothetical protein
MIFLIGIHDKGIQEMDCMIEPVDRDGVEEV